MTTITTFKYIELIDNTGGDCECCGGFLGSGKQVYVNDKLVWEVSSDGHYSGFRTEGSMINLVINEWSRPLFDSIDEKSTEEARHEWNKAYVGNSIALTPDSWKENCREDRECYEAIIENIVDQCVPEHMPYDEYLQLRMIALWIEDHMGEAVDVIKEEGKYE